MSTLIPIPLFYIFRKRILTNDLKGYDGTVSIGGRTTALLIWHRWISRWGRRTGKISWASRQSLHSLRIGNKCWEDKVDDNISGINTEITVNGQKLETVTSFKYRKDVEVASAIRVPFVLKRAYRNSSPLGGHTVRLTKTRYVHDMGSS